MSAIEQFPIMLGRAAATSDDRGLKIVVDPNDINWPDITEASAGNMTIASLQRNGFAWSRWSQAAHTADLAQRPSNPMVGVHIVKYACGGISVHTKIRHLVVDGSGAWRFYQTWAQTFQAERKQSGSRRTLVYLQDNAPQLLSRSAMFSALASPPSAIQGAVAEHINQMSQYFDSVLERQLHVASKDHMETFAYSVRKFSLTHEAVTRLKARHGDLALCSPEHRQFVSAHNIGFVSTNDLICSVFWRAITRAHHALNANDPETCMMLACDMRSRIGLPPKYTGNASFPLIMNMDKGQIMRQTITDTATWIRRQINILSPEYVKQMSTVMASPEDMQRLISIFHPSNSFFSASIISGFPMFDMVDFGFGKPVHIDVPPYLTPGFSIWMPTRSTAQLAKTPTTSIDIALREDVYQLMLSDAEFGEYLEVVY
ncbi:hypothetical protein GGI21_002295 [Coemansia aciculifera]|nr:hypothetical protein GGI21_002295 [Coemansia aciculifera]